MPHIERTQLIDPDAFTEVKMVSSETYWAKGPRDDAVLGESLADHTRAVLQRVASLRTRAPFLSQFGDEPRLWHRLALAAAVHDLGKTDPRFQQMLKSSKPYDQRHEILSLAWLDWLLGDDRHEDRLWIAAAVGSHHRDSSFLFEKYSLGSVVRPTTNIADFLEPIPDVLFQQAADYFLDSIVPELLSLKLLDPEWSVPARWTPSPDDKRLAETSITRHLRLWSIWMQDRQPAEAKRLGILTRGLILLADHAGSAQENFRRIDLLTDAAATTARLAPPKGNAFYPHQDEAGETVGQALLIAPTGSGKTEAALRWAANQYEQTAGYPPLFYVLPFKASMNAMRHRLVEKLTPVAAGEKTRGDLVTLQHSSALQVLYNQLMQDDPKTARPAAKSTSQAAWLAKRQQNLAKLHTTPLRILSPYQLLRAAYQLKGHEAIWTDAAGGLFIFDEIHAYEPARLARILEMLRFLIEKFGAKAFVMTATMPPPIREYVAEILGHPEPIRATNETYAQFRRHRLRLCETGLLDDATVAQIVDRIREGEAVLCVATTVKRAQQLQQKLREALGDQTEVKLLHSRFTGKDRDALETEVRKAVATNAQAGQRKNIVLVATQVVEVSLDVDFDVLFSDPAPIEALLQRFGRVNRSRRPEPHDVIVCAVLDDAFPVYEDQRKLVEAGLQVLRTADGSIIDESQVQTWIDYVYAGPTGAKILHDIKGAADDFRTTILDQLQPFDTKDDLEQMFYDQFDGEEVLPKCKVDEYRELLETEPIQAAMLTVPVSQMQHQRLGWQKRLIKPAALGLPPKSPDIADVPYDSTSGLKLDLSPKEDHS